MTNQEMDIEQALGFSLYRIRTHQGLTLQELSRRSSIYIDRLVRYERRVNRVSTFVKICHALGVNASFVLFALEEPRKTVEGLELLRCGRESPASRPFNDSSFKPLERLERQLKELIHHGEDDDV